MIEITLENFETEEKETFRVYDIPTGKMFDVLGFVETEYEKESEQIKAMLHLMVTLFNQQFTFEDLLAKTRSNEIGDICADVIEKALSNEEKKTGLKKKAVKAQK